jgi:DNA-binding CsgD family transcriptional regulator/predicted negative regulator of RcsB-dependent stress response
MPHLRSALARGNRALAAGEWETARAAFEEALCQGVTAEALEGLSQAAWWLNDGDTTIRSREAAFRLLRESGDDLGAARIAIWLGSDYEDFRGELAIASGWREQARRLLAPHPVGEEHGWLEVFEADAVLFFNEDTAAAVEHVGRAVEIGRQCGAGDMVLLASAIEGLALVSQGDLDQGMKLLDGAAASVLAGDIKDEIWANRIVCYLIFACERVRDFQRAAQWCDKLRELADRIRLTFAQGVCRAHYAGILMSRGQWDEAEQHLAEATRFIMASRPGYAAECAVRLAELRLRQGRREEAEAMLRNVEWHPAAMLSLAEIALDAGRLQDAEELVERYLRHMPEANRLQRVPGLELLVRVAALQGKRQIAAGALATLQATSEAVATPPLRGAAAFSAASLAAADNNYNAARTSLEDAVLLFEQSRAPYEAARARLELAGVLVSLGRLDRAASEAATALSQLERLGSVFHARRAAALVRDLERRKAPAASGAGSDLTARQRDILRLVAEVKSDREIAIALGLSEHTVHRHVANILLRLDLPTRAAAAAYAASRGLI